jgi:glycosyltransferase involved in cell wall biosynthesis
MRITFLTHYPGRGGSGSLLLQLTDFFRLRGHTISIVVGDDDKDPIFKDYSVVAAKHGSPWIVRMRSYVQAIEQTKPDMVYSISGTDEIDVLRFLSFPRARHVSSMEEHDYLNMPYLLRQMDGFYEAVTANTPDVLESIVSDAPKPLASRVAPYRIAKPFFERPAPRPIQNRPIEVCFVGRLEAFQKRAHWLPSIIAGCAKQGAPLRWHIYGDGPLKDSIERRVAKNGCAAEVQFHGWLNASELSSRLANHDIFFLCSRWEGLPISMVEAMLCGLACVVPGIPGGMTYAIKQCGGFPYSADNPRSAISALCAASQSPSTLDKTKIQAQQKTRSLFAEEQISRDLNSLESEFINLRFNRHVLTPETSRPLQSVPLPTVLRRTLFKPITAVQSFWEKNC